jgi:hypothetical protein
MLIISPNKAPSLLPQNTTKETIRLNNSNKATTVATSFSPPSLHDSFFSKEEVSDDNADWTAIKMEFGDASSLFLYRWMFQSTHSTRLCVRCYSHSFAEPNERPIDCRLRKWRRGRENCSQWRGRWRGWMRMLWRRRGNVSWLRFV